MKMLGCRWIAVLAAATVLVGCESSGTLNSPAGGAPVETRSTAVRAPGAATPAAAAHATPQSRVATVDLAPQAGPGADGSAGAAGAALSPALRAAARQRVIYFDFDSFAIKSEYAPMLDAHAKLLLAARASHMVVEGHSDERGGREYNLALGQKRAEAVVKALVVLGVPVARLEATSLGEERPAVQGNDEAAWAKNRRAELKDR